MDAAEAERRFAAARGRYVPPETARTVGDLIGKPATGRAPVAPTPRPPYEPPPIDPMIGVPPEYARWSLADYSQDIAAAVEPFLAREAWCLYLHGNTGSRKSSLAAAVLAEMRRRYPALRRGGYGGFVEADTFRNATLKIDWGQPRIEGWCVAGLILLDDICATRATPVVVEKLVIVVGARYNHRRPTIVTSNLSLAALADATDPRIASRLGQGVVLDLGARDWRLAQ